MECISCPASQQRATPQLNLHPPGRRRTKALVSRLAAPCCDYAPGEVAVLVLLVQFRLRKGRVSDRAGAIATSRDTHSRARTPPSVASGCEPASGAGARSSAQSSSSRPAKHLRVVWQLVRPPAFVRKLLLLVVRVHQQRKHLAPSTSATRSAKTVFPRFVASSLGGPPPEGTPSGGGSGREREELQPDAGAAL